MTPFYVKLIFAVMAGLLSELSFAQRISEADSNHSPTAYLYFDFGFATHKSELVLSNDTGTSLAYGFGFYAGQERDIGVLLRTDTANVNFELNNSNVQTTWEDTVIRYRMGYFYLGAIIGRVTLLSKKEDADQLDLVGSGYGGNAGFFFPFKKNAVAYVDVNSVSISNVREADKKDASMGSRMDIDLGASFDLTKQFLDFMCGYRQRTYAVSSEDSGGTETFTTTYLGLRFAAFF